LKTGFVVTINVQRKGKQNGVLRIDELTRRSGNGHELQGTKLQLTTRVNRNLSMFSG
jgi:hypothetical protein